jgi:tellurite methyltransferase
MQNKLQQAYGNIDIYLFDQLLKGPGLAHLVKPLGKNGYLLPDGSERFLVNEEVLLKYTNQFGVLYEPIKTTNVQNMRCMTTWCVQKH